jgi:hypothetical protein
MIIVHYTLLHVNILFGKVLWCASAYIMPANTIPTLFRGRVAVDADAHRPPKSGVESSGPWGWSAKYRAINLAIYSAIWLPGIAPYAIRTLIICLMLFFACHDQGEGWADAGQRNRKGCDSPSHGTSERAFCKIRLHIQQCHCLTHLPIVLPFSKQGHRQKLCFVYEVHTLETIVESCP